MLLTVRNLSCAFLLAAVASAQTPAATPPSPNTPRDLKLVGGRFHPLKWEELTADQRTLIDNTLAAQGTVGGPTNIYLRSPVMGDLAQKMYNELRQHSAIPTKLSEFAVMMVAREWTAEFQWYVHSRAAIRAGLSPDVANAVAAGKRPASMKPDEQAIYDYCDELLKTKRVSDAKYNAVVQQFGEKGVVDLMGVLGYFHMVAIMLNTDGYPLPDGVQPPLALPAR